jgi:hypothetical protein
VVGGDDDIFLRIFGNDDAHLVHVRLLVGVNNISDGIILFDVDALQTLDRTDVSVGRNTPVSIAEIGLDFAAFATGFYNEQIIKRS